MEKSSIQNEIEISESSSMISNKIEKNLIFEKDESSECSLSSTFKDIFDILPSVFFFNLSIGVYELFSIHFVGYKLPKEEAKQAVLAIGLSTIYTDCILLPFIFELMCTFEVYGSNAFGLKNYDLLKKYFKRGFIITLIFLIMLITLHYFIGPLIFSLFIYEKQTLFFIKSFFQNFIFYLVFETIFSFMIRYMNIIEINNPAFIILCFTMILHPLWAYIFIDILNLGVKGAAYAINLSCFLNSISILIYIGLSNNILLQDLFKLERECFREWWNYLKFALSNLFMICSNFWLIPILTYICNIIGHETEILFVMVLKINFVALYLYFSYEICSNILVSKKLTSNSTILNKYILYLFVIGLIMSLFFCINYIVFRGYLILLVLDDVDFSESAKSTILLLAVWTLFDYSHNMLLGVMRSLRLQIWGSIISVVSNYCISLVFAIILGKYFQLEVKGVFLGLIIGSLFTSITFYIKLLLTDINKIRNEVIEELELENRKLE